MSSAEPKRRVAGDTRVRDDGSWDAADESRAGWLSSVLSADRRMQIVDPRRRVAFGLAVLIFVVLLPATVYAYVGPGAGIAFMTTALVLLSTIFVFFAGALVWPLRWLWKLIRRKRPPKKPKIKKAVVIGLDGLDPRLTARWMKEGKLPNLKRLSEIGSFNELGTTYPAMSPVAWSSFATGVNPGKHGIYDFLTRDPRSYLPDLSSADVGPPSRFLDLGKWRIPLGKPRLRLLRRSKPFWKSLAGYQIPCHILRVPITFPAEEFAGGTLLSAMCVPDLQGSQGTFTCFFEKRGESAQTETSTESASTDDAYAVGQSLPIEIKDNRGVAVLRGPLNPIRSDGHQLELELELSVDREGGTLTVEIPGTGPVVLRPGTYSEWTEIAFSLGLGLKLRGMARLRALELDPVRLYISPINIDPSRPVLPISHPRFFSMFLSRLIGRFATLGLAEDTWALNEGVLDDDAFLEQAWANHGEREAMLFQMLKRLQSGLLTCVFDGTDRIQHMFMRYTDPDHPAVADEDRELCRDVIEETYIRCDEMLGRVMKEVDPADPQNLVLVMSDHGFESFRRGINLNTWLRDEGYLVLEDDKDLSGEWFRGVDWGKTRAFAVGLGGIFLNVVGREKQGIVPAGDEAWALAREIAEKLNGLEDPDVGDVAINEVFLANEIYSGPYVEDAPELIVGYNGGYRASWDGARGVVGAPIFSDNTKAWSGDHCIDPRLVPGVLIANRELEAGATIMDVAPTILDLFGLKVPRHMDGASLVPSGHKKAERKATVAEVAAPELEAN